MIWMEIGLLWILLSIGVPVLLGLRHCQVKKYRERVQTAREHFHRLYQWRGNRPSRDYRDGERHHDRRRRYRTGCPHAAGFDRRSADSSEAGHDTGRRLPSVRSRIAIASATVRGAW